MNKYSKNGREEECDEIPDEDEDKFKRLRKRRQGRRRNSIDGDR